MLGYEHTLMYGRYREDLGQFARTQAQKLDALRGKGEAKPVKKGFKKYKSAWQSTLTGPFLILITHLFDDCSKRKPFIHSLLVQFFMLHSLKKV